MGAGISAALVALAFGVAGCGEDTDEVGGDTPTVEVLESGSEPRQELVLDVEPGDEATTTLTFDFSTSGTLDGSPLPEQDVPVYSIDFTTTVDEVTDEEITSSFAYDEVRVERAGADPAVVEQLESQLGALQGTGGTLTQAPSGAVIEGTVDQPEGLDPVLESLLSQTNEQLKSVTVPFPEEPVGVGAQWQSDTSFEIGGVTTNQAATYSLAELDGDRYALEVEIEQTVVPGEIEGGGSIIDSDTAGGGRLEGSLSSLSPVQSSVSTSGTVTSEVPASDGATQELVQEIEVEVTLESG
ncbi:MAG: hypothetical protein M3331_02310 [Actinomycetota bacterium]|nr:hypothetical protein [Actinomycetota bacterium]